MTRSALNLPSTDPTPIFDAFRGVHATELLTVAVVHLKVFGHLADQPLSLEQLRQRLGLAERPANVLITALRAMGLLVCDLHGRLALAELAREHLLPDGAFYVGDYIGLASESAGVLAMLERLRTNRPAGVEPTQAGAAFVYREGLASAMESEASARSLTLALAGRARNVAPALARAAPLEGASLLLDVGGGTGLYSIACLQRYPRLRAVVWDRPEVLKVTQEFAHAHGVSDRLACQPGNMFTDAVPTGADALLLSNVLHDWDVPECRHLLARCAEALRPGGRLLIHDVFLSDDLDGPLPVALYSAALFSLTEGRAYSAAEYRTWLREVGLRPEELRPTLVRCSVLPAVKSAQ